MSGQPTEVAIERPQLPPVGRYPTPIRDVDLYRAAVWISLETWLIGDGQLPELGLGAVLRDCGLRLNSSSLNATDQSLEGVREVRIDDVGRVRYEVIGRCQSVTSPMAALIAMPDWVTIAEPEVYRRVEGALDSPAVEPWFEQFRPPAPNEMLKAEGWLGVVADHEWDAFAIPDSRMDWRLQRIQLIEHQMVRVHGEPPDTHTFGPVVRATHVDRLSRAADGVMGARYLVDLLPA